MTKSEILAAIVPLVPHTTNAIWLHEFAPGMSLRVHRFTVDHWRVSVRRGSGSVITVLTSRLARSAERAATVARWMLTKYAPPVVVELEQVPTAPPPLRVAVATYFEALDSLRDLDAPKLTKKLRGKALEHTRNARRRALEKAERALRWALDTTPEAS